jgi:hypothetical protein
MTMVTRFLDGVGSVILWLDFAIQAVGVIFRCLLFRLITFFLPFCGTRDHEWKLKPKSLPEWYFAALWIGSVFTLFWSLSIWVLGVVLILEFFWSLYALVNGKGERRREIFFHTLGINLIALLLFFVVIGGLKMTTWRSVDHFQHHGNLEAYCLVGFLVLRAGLFPFHVNRLDLLCEMSVWLGLAQTIFNSWVIFQMGLLIKTVGFMDIYGDYSTIIMTWVLVSFLFGIALSAMQIRSKRMWAHIAWMLGHIALYVTAL